MLLYAFCYYILFIIAYFMRKVRASYYTKIYYNIYNYYIKALRASLYISLE